MKVIAVGDPHIQVDNIPEVTLFINKLEDLVITEEPDLIVILGDVLHTHERLHTIPLNKAYDMIDRMRKLAMTFVLVGNHDYIQNRQYLTSNHWMNGMKEWNNVKIIDVSMHEKIKGMDLVFCPYVPPGRFQDALNDGNMDWKNADCIFAHQEFYGCKMGAIISIEGDKWSEDFPQIVSGHIHSRQIPQKNIYYCGSSMQHAFGESEKNIIPILTWSKPGKPYILNEVDLGLPRKKIIYTDVQAIETISCPETEDKLKISVSGIYDEFKAFKKTKKYRELIGKGIKVVFKPKRNEKINRDLADPVEEQSFNEVLLSLVSKEKNPALYQAYELTVNNVTINEDDILFL